MPQFAGMKSSASLCSAAVQLRPAVAGKWSNNGLLPPCFAHEGPGKRTRHFFSDLLSKKDANSSPDCDGGCGYRRARTGVPPDPEAPGFTAHSRSEIAWRVKRDKYRPPTFCKL